VIHIDPRHGRSAVLEQLRERLGGMLVAGEDGLKIPV